MDLRHEKQGRVKNWEVFRRPCPSIELLLPMWANERKENIGQNPNIDGGQAGGGGVKCCRTVRKLCNIGGHFFPPYVCGGQGP